MAMVIEAGKTEGLYWRDLWRYRELFYFLAWRDILVRYKQTVIGVAWGLIRPLLTTIIFTFAFHRLAHFNSTAPYMLFVCAAVLPWQFFASSLTESSTSLITNVNLISKVYFPRVIVPTSAVIVCLVDFLISGVILVGLLFWYHYLPDWRILTLPLFTLLGFGAAMGAGLWFAALNVKFRDFRYIVPFVVQFGIYVSPVGLSSSEFSSHYRLLLSLNPMVGVIDGFRWAILRGTEPLYLPGLLLSIVSVVLMLAGSLWYFRRTERSFADVI